MSEVFITATSRLRAKSEASCTVGVLQGTYRAVIMYHHRIVTVIAPVAYRTYEC